MSSTKTGRLILLISSLLAVTALSLPGAAVAVKARKPVPHANTGGATHVLGTSALLTATVNPDGVETSYIFQWGTTAAYGSQIPAVPVNLGSGTTRERVGQPISGLTPGGTYHFRVVAFAYGLPFYGRDHIFRTKGNALAFTVERRMQTAYGAPFIFSGTLTGLGSANHKIVLQASPFPYLESFTNIGAPGVTDANGRFSFRVSNLRASTQFRVSTLDLLPIYSLVTTVNVSVTVTIHARSGGRTGLVRLYGTVSPAVSGAKVFFQVQKAVRPGRSEQANRWVSELSTGIKHGEGNSSRYSAVVTILHGGRYRAFVRLPPGGPLVSGWSRSTIILHASPNARRGKKK